jgi:LPXTG-motif cell wall-anchored protein
VGCPFGFQHPGHEPVLLVHGTSLTAAENWSWSYEVALPAAGFDVCTVQLPDRALSDVQVASEYTAYAIREVATRAHRKIAVVGVSQGGIEPRWALKWWPDTRQLVRDYIGMASPNHGALFANADCVDECPPALWQHVTSSQFITALNSGAEVYPPVAYTDVYSTTDWVIQPSLINPTAALTGGTNIAVQSICPGRFVDHVQSIADAVYYAVVLDALTHPGHTADPSRIDPGVCQQLFLPGVDPATAAAHIAEIYETAGVVQAQHAKTTAEPALACYVTSSCLSVAPNSASGFGASTAPRLEAQQLPNTGPDPASDAEFVGLLVLTVMALAGRRRRHSAALAWPTT